MNDDHLPVEDGTAIQAQGRHDYNTGWGRVDTDPADRGHWIAFTNDQFNLNLEWVVRHHPEHGRSVLLYAAGDGTIMHTRPHGGEPLLFRAGGYWWDGQGWHRPLVSFDRSTEEYVRVPVPDGRSITAADWMARHPGSPDRGHCVDITVFDPAAPESAQWAHDLAAWAAQRPTDGLPLDRCVVDVAAAEIDGEGALLAVGKAARAVGLSRSELRDARMMSGAGRAERFPLPQRYTSSGSPAWSKPVLDEWAWERQRTNPHTVVSHLRRGDRHPDMDALIAVTAHAALWDMRYTYDSDAFQLCSILLPTEKVIKWFATEQPRLLEALLGEITRQARDELNLPDEAITQALRDAIILEFEDDDAAEQLLRLTLPPSLNHHDHR